MKKKLLLTLLVVMTLVCLFTITVSAETALKPQDTNAYGELSFFDESISVGRTNAANGFTPYIDAGSTTYARVVVGDGTTFYTFPTAYILSGTTIYGSSGKNIFIYDLTSLNSAMQTATGENPGWTAGNNIYRIEMPYTVNRVNGSGQNFGGFSNVIEITLQPNSAVQDANKNCIFWKCHNLETINNLDTFVFKKGCLGGSFQECKKLTTITIGVSPDVVSTDSNAFNGCTSLQNFNIGEAFPNLTTVGDNMFYNCTSLKSIEIPETVVTISTKAFSYSGIETITFSKVGNLERFGDAVFEKCTSLTKLEIPEGVTYLGNCFAKNCSSLTSLSLPSTLETLYDNGHFQYASLTSIKGLENTKLTKIPYAAFQGAIDSNIGTLKLPVTCTYVATYAFADCNVETVILSPALVQMDVEAFVNCPGLKNVYVPGGLTTVGGSTFKNNHTGNICFFVTSTNETYLESVKGWFDCKDIVTLETYNNDKATYATGRHIISGLNLCETFYNGHDTEGVVGVNQFKGDKYVTDYICVSGCNRNCGMQAETKLCGPLFTNKGYSKIADGTMFTYGVVINEENIAEYVATGKAFNYGVIIGAANFDSEGNLIETNAIIDNTGKALINNSIVVDFSNVELENFTIYNVKMQGIETEAQRNLPIYCCAYIIDGESVYYMGNEVTENAKTISSSTITVIETTTTTPPVAGDDNA